MRRWADASRAVTSAVRNRAGCFARRWSARSHCGAKPDTDDEAEHRQFGEIASLGRRKRATPKTRSDIFSTASARPARCGPASMAPGMVPARPRQRLFKTPRCRATKLGRFRARRSQCSQIIAIDHDHHEATTCEGNVPDRPRIAQPADSDCAPSVLRLACQWASQ